MAWCICWNSIGISSMPRFVINEGGGGGLRNGRPVGNSVQAAEKGLPVIHPGDHQPRAATARYRETTMRSMN